MIDLHTHVLPGIDDGPGDLDGAVAMARTAAMAGTRVMVATPHLRADHPRVQPEELAHRAAALSVVLEERGIPIEVLPGAEIDLGAAARLSDGELQSATIAGNGIDVLIETPHRKLPRDFEDQIARIQERGFRVTLAHPERNPSFQNTPRRLGRLVENGGVLVQVTARAVGTTRSSSGGLCGLAIHRGWVHFIASDAHDVWKRSPVLTSALQLAAHTMPRFGAELAWMTYEAPAALVAGEPLPARPARAPRRLQRLLRS